MAKKTKKPAGLAGKIIKTTLSAIAALVLAVLMLAVNILLPSYDRMANAILDGIPRSVSNKGIDTAGLDLAYNKADYTKAEFAAAKEAFSRQIGAEGIVLLQNDGLLPLAAGTAVSLFSANSDQSAGGGFVGGGTPIKDVLNNAGLSVNDTLWNFYTRGKGKDYGLASGSINYGDAEDFRINEAPLSVLQSETGLLDSVNGTIPVYWLKRVAGEGRDMPRSMYNHADSAEDKARTYLEPDSTELEILQYLNDNYTDVILVVNSNAALELGWIKDYPAIKAVLYAPDGLQALGDILTGAVNPSGRTVDTFAADALQSPAAQNFGDYQYSDENGSLTKYNYVTYAEGIYVGYKYYETRYEDVVLKQGNAGSYDYDTEVVYPFGYGLSYTTFGWSDFTVKENTDSFDVSVKVTNTGSAAGKDVVEIYLQSPYTDYDRQHGVEKAAVQLVGFGKTKELAAGESETVIVNVSKELLKAYDRLGAKTYILDAGTYYLTAGRNAHAAVNNVLAAKGAAVSGDASLVGTYQAAVFDARTYAVDSYSGETITNRLDAAAGDTVYLTRSDWAGTFPEHDGVPSSHVSTWGNEINGSDGVSYTYTRTVSAADLAKLDSFDSGNPNTGDSYTDNIVYGAKNGIVLSQLRGKDFDDPLWDDLLDELTSDDYYKLIALSGYGIEFIESVNKPFNLDADTAAGLIWGGAESAYTNKLFPNSMTLCQTWNKEFYEAYGEMIGNDGLLGNADGWYAPSMNIHRTPFSGRNGEYYSEDGFLSGTIGSLEVKGCASKGMYTYIKHFAFNDQENHRGDREGQYSIATFLNEQAAREIYLVPFEMSMKVGDITLNYIETAADGTLQNATRQIRACQAIMSGFNRLGYTWVGGHYDLLTGIVRGEWAFQGMILTDNANTGVFMDGLQMIEAGADMKLTYAEESARFNWDPADPEQYHYARAAAHRVLYTIANSKAMNGAAPGGTFARGMSLTEKITIAVNVICTILLALLIFFTIRRFLPGKGKYQGD